MPADTSAALSASSSVPMRPAASVALVALVYALTGWGALAFAIPPGYASPLYPAAGVALVALLVCGPRAAWGVWLGSFAVYALLGWRRGDSGAAAAALAALLGAGAAAQALCGAWLVQRYVDAPLTLDSPGAIWRFFAFGALLACAVGATVGVAALAAAGMLPPTRLVQTWLTWWSGDALGVIVGAPVALSLVGQPTAAWRPRRSSVALPLLIAMGLLAVAIWQEGHWQRARDDARFERDASAVAHSVELRLAAHLDALEALHSVFLASNAVTGEEFRRATAVWLRKLPSIQALGWHERVPREAIPGFEAAARADGLAGFRVFDREPGHANDPAVYAMRRVEPAERNSAALGVNVLSIAAARAAIGRAEVSDAAFASAGFRLTQDAAGPAGVVVYRAVHGAGGPAGGPPRGLVFLTLRMEDTLARLTAGAPSYLRVCLIDTDAEPGATRLAGAPGCAAAAAPSSTVHRSALPFAGRAWELRVEAFGGVAGRTGSDHGAAWLFSVTALAAAGMMGALLLMVTGRARRTEVAVAARTEELREQIAERRLAESALRQSERRFRDIFQAVPVGVAYTDLQGRIEQPNQAFCTLTGYTESELLGLSVPALTHAADRAADAEARAGLLDGRVPMVRLRLRYLTKAGQTLWVHVTMSLLRDEQGAPFRIVGLIEDLSEPLRLEEAERARERAEVSNRAKSEFLSRMSHELRTPLNGMLGFAQLLDLDRETPLGDRHHRWVGQIQQAGWHLLDMINDVLDLSRIESGTLQLQVEPLSLEPLIVASMALVAPQAAQRRIELIRDLTDHAPLHVLADATRVKQILTNLLSNAVKYNHDGGRVLIGTRIAAPAAAGTPVLELTVTDTGVGMTPLQLGQLFQPFNRLGRERSSTEGTGIGLVIARLLAERHGGSLDASSEAGRGSTFRLRLPLTSEAHAVTEAGGLDGVDATAYHSRHVLYIEDNDINVEVMRGILARRPQVRLEVATTGLDGLATVRTSPPDLVLLDMGLPDIGGMSLLQHLKADERTADIPVVVVSADAMPAQIQAALAAGAVRYLTKPVSVEDLLAAVDEQLAQAVTRFG
ncbi:MAG TPA: CHASE domain-containing protein [Methylibium sp.]|nr:CHASE domain-containing protein [Methylibium sp.]